MAYFLFGQKKVGRAGGAKAFDFVFEFEVKDFEMAFDFEFKLLNLNIWNLMLPLILNRRNQKTTNSKPRPPYPPNVHTSTPA
ncbi:MULTISPECIES: hypothetical protein [Cupriavidus]